MSSIVLPLFLWPRLKLGEHWQACSLNIYEGGGHRGLASLHPALFTAYTPALYWWPIAGRRN